MKKFLIFAILLLFSLFSFGQYSVGGRMGVNFSTITGRYSKDDDTKGGWVVSFPTIGAIGSYELTDMISLNAELLFITIGDKTKYSETGEGEKSSLSEYDYSNSERYHYFQLPVMARFNFGDNFHYYCITGLYFGYVIGAHYKDKFGDEVCKGRIRYKETSDDPDDWYLNPKYNRRADFGLNLGGGVSKEIGPGNLEAELRFGMGFLDHNKFDSKDDKGDEYKSFRNVYIGLTFAYMYDLSKK
jgi:hypothetical protein